MRARLAVVVIVLSCVFLTAQTGRTWSAFSAVTANPSSSFASAASFGSCGYTPAAITPVWMTGFEHGVVTAAASSGLLDIDWNGNNNGMTADTAVKRSGNYALKLVAGAAVDGGRSRSVSSSMVVFRIAFRFASLPTADVENMLGVWSTNGNELNIGYVNSSQKLSLGFVSSTQRLSATSISANTWYVLDVRANYGANPHTADWQLNAVAQTQASKAAAAETPTEIWLGPDGPGGPAFTIWFDDFLISATSGDYPIGDGRVLGLSPNGVSSISNPGSVLKTSGGVDPDTTSWQMVDDVPISGGADHIRQTAINTGAYVALDMADTSETCINGVQGEVAYASQNTNNAVAKTSVYAGATERVVYNGLMNPGATVTYRAAVVAPASGTWDQAKVNALTTRVGHLSAATSNYVAWGAVMLEYNVDL